MPLALVCSGLARPLRILAFGAECSTVKQLITSRRDHDGEGISRDLIGEQRKDLWMKRQIADLSSRS